MDRSLGRAAGTIITRKKKKKKFMCMSVCLNAYAFVCRRSEEETGCPGPPQTVMRGHMGAGNRSLLESSQDS